MKFEVFWKVIGNTGRERNIYRGSDIIEFEGKITKDKADDILSELANDDWDTKEKYDMPNFNNAMTPDSVIENFIVIKIKELKKEKN